MKIIQKLKLNFFFHSIYSLISATVLCSPTALALYACLSVLYFMSKVRIRSRDRIFQLNLNSRCCRAHAAGTLHIVVVVVIVRHTVLVSLSNFNIDKSVTTPSTALSVHDITCIVHVYLIVHSMLFGVSTHCPMINIYSSRGIYKLKPNGWRKATTTTTKINRITIITMYTWTCAVLCGAECAEWERRQSDFEMRYNIRWHHISNGTRPECNSLWIVSLYIYLPA